MQRFLFYLIAIFGVYMINSKIYASFRKMYKVNCSKNDSIIQTKPDTSIIWVVKIMVMTVVNVLICSSLFYMHKNF